MDLQLNPAFFSFGTFTLDVERRELRGAEGPVKLVGKPFDVLVYLVKHRHRVVPGEELFEAIWNPDGSADRVFDPEYIQQAVSVVRKTLGDNAKSPLYVLTDRGRGIRFIGQVEPRPPGDLPT